MPTDSVRTLRLIGAAMLLIMGAIHTSLAFRGYGTSTLETMFYFNGAASAAVAGAIVMVRHPLSALAGAGVAGGTLMAFALSRLGPGLAGFRATGLEPSPEAVVALAVGTTAVAVLGTVVVLQRHQLLAFGGPGPSHG